MFVSCNVLPTSRYFHDGLKENKSVVVFWVVMPCSLVGGYQGFGGSITHIFRVEDYMASQLR
jgi:hypothetical protein